MSEEKYYIGEIAERHGENEISVNIRFRTEDPTARLDEIASTWYGENKDKNDNVIPTEMDNDEYIFQGGCIAVSAANFQEVTKEVYEAVSIITEL